MHTLLTQKRFGVILRVFAKTPDQVEKNLAQVLETAKMAEDLTIDGQAVFAKILIVVPMDSAYADCDCGETLPALRKVLRPGGKIDTLAIEHGDLFCVALNRAAAKLLRHSVDYGLIVSHGAKAYLRTDTVKQLLDAHLKGAVVSGIAIDELAPSILEGRIANTFAMWRLEELIGVGGFDLRAAQRRKDKPNKDEIDGWDKEKGFVSYPYAGVEEIIPLIQLTRNLGPCIAPIVPAGSAKWIEPDAKTDPEGYARSRAKLGTKLGRQADHASSVGAGLDILKGGVMPEYRQF